MEDPELMSIRKPYVYTERALFVGHTLVAPRVKVAYMPTTKSACSSIKMMLAEANDSYAPDNARFLHSPNISVAQAIHQIEVSGLDLFRYLPKKEQDEIWESPDWWRVGALRHPYARTYSAFENRILMQAPSTLSDEVWEHCTDDRVEGNIDIAATFRRFVRALRDKPELFYVDDHFTAQWGSVRDEHVRYTHFFRVDKPGEMDRFARDLSERSGRTITPKRLNEGLGIKYRDVMDAGTASIIEEIYADDFARYGFEHEIFPSEPVKLITTARETRAIEYSRDITQRMRQISRLARTRRGWKYGVAQVLRDIGLRPKPPRGSTNFDVPTGRGDQSANR
ncbi:MAG: hypothetical protein EBV24_05525 [Actinobacteria bacterium]|nr:hypothetical protein [Actinomycetota bacterium]